MNDITRVAIYARVSTEEQADHGYSIDAQLETLREYVKKSNGKIVSGEYVDAGVSGKSIEGRGELQRLLAHAKEGRFDEVIVWKVNRLARNTIDLLQIVDHLNRYNISFRSFSESFETETPMGKFALQMMGAVGEFERNTIVDNVRLGMRQRAKKGKWNGGVVLGYRSIKAGDQSTLEVIPEEAAIVHRIFELYTTGKGLWGVASQLNQEGHRTKLGNLFSPQGIAKILDNPVYIGKIRYDVQQDWGRKRRKGTNKEPIVAEGNHEPIVSEELWGKVRTLREAKASKPPRTFYGEYPLTGLMRCPQCGSTMVAARTHKKLKSGRTNILRYYVCGNHRNRGKVACRANSVNADQVEALVYRRLREVVSRPKVLRDVVAKINARRNANVGPLREELDALTKALARVEATKEKYFKLYESDAIDTDSLVGRLEELKKEVATISARKATVEAEIKAGTAAPISFEVVREALRRFNEVLAAAPPEHKKTLLQLIIRQIHVTEDRKIDKIEISFDESVQEHFMGEGPSASSAEGPSLQIRIAI